MRWKCFLDRTVRRAAPALLLWLWATSRAGGAAPDIDGGLASPADFDWNRPVLGEMEPGKTYRFKIPPSVFQGSKIFPYDLLIVDERGEPWPFTVWTPAPKKEYRPARVERLESVSAPDPASRMINETLRVLPGPAGQGPTAHNRLTVYSSGSDFVRRVEIRGSPDRQKWTLLGAGYLVNFQQRVSVNKRTISYLDSNLPYLEVRLFPDSRQPADQPAIRQLELGLVTDEPVEMEEIPLLRVQTGPGDESDGVQTLVYDSQILNGQIDRISVEARESFFRKAVKIYMSNEEPFSWRWVADGEIHRMPDELITAVDLDHFSGRFFKLEILGYDDDPPLTVTGVHAEAAPRYLVMEAGRGRSPVLYYGSLKVAPQKVPRAARREGGEAAKAPLVALKGEPGPSGLAARVTRRLAGPVGLVMLAVAGLWYGLYRKGRRRMPG